MKKITKDWIEIGKRLGKDPNEKIECPVCKYKNLKVKDIPSEIEENLFERIIYCPNCNAKIYLRMNKN